MKTFVVFAALCMAAIAMADPAKPNPPTQFTTSVFFMQKGSSAATIYYDQVNQRYRLDLLDDQFKPEGEYLSLSSSEQSYWYDASGVCTSGKYGGWINVWDSVLDNATFSGVDEFFGKQCNIWTVQKANGDSTAACFNDKDKPLYIATYVGSESQPDSVLITTSFTASVDPNAFNVPSACKNSFKLSTHLPMNLKKFKAPAHPLLF